MTEILTYKQVKNYDPSHTISLRAAFVRAMNKRFTELALVVKRTVYDNDCFGLKPAVHTFQMNPAPNKAFLFSRSADKVEAFMEWLQKQVDAGIIQLGTANQLGTSVESAWFNLYILDSYKRGVLRARDELRKAGYPVPTIEASGGIMAVLNSPFHIDRAGILFTQAYSDLKGITAAMDMQISRILAQGIIDGDGPALLARKLVATINGTGMGELGITNRLGRFIPASQRAEMLARNGVLKAYNEAGLQEYKNWGVTGLKVMAEWATAGDDRVCFPATTKVKVGGKFKNINQIKVGDLVLTHRDRYEKVIDIFRRRYDGGMVKITLKGGHYNDITLTATENHYILVNGGWMKMKDIKMGNKINYIANKCPVCNKLMPSFNKYCSQQCNSVISNKILWSDPRQKDRLREDNRKYNETHSISKIQIAKSVYMEKMKGEDFSKWFKEQVSKGQLASYKDNPDHLKNVTLSNQEKGQRDGWGWKNKEKRDKDLIKAHIAMGKNHNGKTYLEKKIEWWLEKEEINYVPQKYFNNGERRFWVDFYLTDYNIIIEADGIHWHDEVSDKIRDDGIKKVFTGTILHFKENDIRNNFAFCVSQVEEIMALQNCFVEVEVRKVERWELKKERWVYNIEVENDKTYTANGIVVHNCDKCLPHEEEVYTLDAASGVLPFHNFCRCIWLPILYENVVDKNAIIGN